ncbi:MAG: hypothetical protein EZS28_014653 [Streblomastix strix]|uniref:Uncharacterized protein n=1 Tax=Streblomastix strix TaxID=222440 RepID=A0A5J4W4F5_9EUKA|nr:MAG: hypothetical protein EZS28_014653 [Streblomastix strix]
MTASETASILLTDNKQAAETATCKDGIIDQILKNLQILPVEEIQFYHILPLYTFFQMIDIDKKRLILDKGVMNMMKSFLNSVNEIINQHIALSIGFLFKAAQIPDEFGSQIIVSLEDLTCKMNSTLSVFALLALDYLAECQCMLQ